MPPSAAESLAEIDVSTAREAPETDACLERVAHRLNRLATLRVTFRSAAVALLAASGLAACAAWLSHQEFRIALALIVVAVALVVLLSLRGLRRRWAGPLEAARWVESRIPLEQRLLTLVSARPGDATARLWPELVADNRTQLGRWRADRLGIAALPANVLLLLVALVTAWLFLVPWYDAGSLPELPGRAAAPQAPAPGGEVAGEGVPSGVGPQSGFQDGTRGADGGAGSHGRIEGAAPTGAIAELQSGLKESFERSLGGSAVLQDSGKPGDGAEPQAARGAVAESGLGKSEAEEGGRVPDEQLARREQDDGSGQTVQHEGGAEGGSAKARPGEGQRGRQAEGGEQEQKKGGAQAGGRAAPGGDAPADGPMALGNEDGTKQHAGGAGAGSGKATGDLLAKKPLTLDGGRHKARFSLTLGGIPGKAGSDGPKSMEAQPSSRIADASAGPQEAARAVRHEEIPAEYEAVVKRIFKRDP